MKPHHSLDISRLDFCYPGPFTRPNSLNNVESSPTMSTVLIHHHHVSSLVVEFHDKNIVIRHAVRRLCCPPHSRLVLAIGESSFPMLILTQTYISRQFPVGMGTGAVYLTLSSLKHHPTWLTTLETVFYSLSIVIFTFNMLMLLLQVICASHLCLTRLLVPNPSAVFPRRTLRLIQHPNEGVLVPLMASPF